MTLRYGRARNDGAWRDWPLREITNRTKYNSITIEVLECGHAQAEKGTIIKPASSVRYRRCRKCAPTIGG